MYNSIRCSISLKKMAMNLKFVKLGVMFSGSAFTEHAIKLLWSFSILHRWYAKTHPNISALYPLNLVSGICSERVSFIVKPELKCYGLFFITSPVSIIC